MTHQIENHRCFDELVEETGSDATFEKVPCWNQKTGEYAEEWIIYLYKYTPSLSISQTRGRFTPNFCPMCGEDFGESEK